MTQQMSYKTYFNEYLKSVFQTEVDLRFWKHFLATSIEKYKLDNPVNRWISQSGFSLYNIQPNGLNTWLHTSQETFSIEIKDLDVHSDNFFTWVMNLAIIRVYNAAELVLIKSIQLKYFLSLHITTNSKKEINKVIAQIKNYLKGNRISVDTTNNRYLIEFLKNKSINFASFLQLPMNTDWKTKWEEFYELFSILRNIITHHAMIVSMDIRNTINSIAKDAFHHYFAQSLNTSDTEILKPKDEHHFLFFVSHVNDFVANTIKFIAEETNFGFIGLHKA